MEKYPRSVYAIQHNKTKKIYIGSSINPKSRYLSHMYALRKGKHVNPDMQSDFDEHGEDYSLFIIDEITCKEEKNKEFDCMIEYKSNIRALGYNWNDIVFRRKKPYIPLKEGVPEVKKIYTPK